jgi:tetratricopeptide (TPR) repeat protein
MKRWFLLWIGLAALFAHTPFAAADRPPVPGCRIWGEPRLDPPTMLTKCDADIAATPARSPMRGELLVKRGQIHLWIRGDRDAAIADFDSAAALLPRDHGPVMYRAEALDEAGRPAEALKDYDRALQLEGDKFDRGSILRGRCWARARSYVPAELAKAEADCGESARLFFGPAPFTYRGMIYIKMRRWSDALRDFEFAMRMKDTGDYAMMLYGRGMAKILSNTQPEEGRADIATALTRRPKMAEYLAARGWPRP